MIYIFLGHEIEHYYFEELWFTYCNTCNLTFASLKLKNGLKKHPRNAARIKYGFVELVAILFTFNTRCDYVLSIFIPKHLKPLHFDTLIQIFCTLFICFVFDDFLKWIYFSIFCTSVWFFKTFDHFKNIYLLSCWFHCFDIFLSNLVSVKTFTFINSF